MLRRSRKKLIFFLVVLQFSALIAEATAVSQSRTEFNLRRGKLPEESYLDLFFGSPPPIATERGILIVDAFHDRNGNGRREAGEETLVGEISCSLDGIDYQVPAFIPGLDYEGSYQLECQGGRFQPSYSEQEIFVRNRGQVIEVALPCRKRTNNSRSEKSP